MANSLEGFNDGRGSLLVNLKLVCTKNKRALSGYFSLHHLCIHIVHHSLLFIIFSFNFFTVDVILLLLPLLPKHTKAEQETYGYDYANC